MAVLLRTLCRFIYDFPSKSNTSPCCHTGLPRVAARNRQETAGCRIANTPCRTGGKAPKYRFTTATRYLIRSKTVEITVRF